MEKRPVLAISALGDPARFVHVAALAERNGWRAEQYGTSSAGLPLVAWWPSRAPTRVIWAAIHGEEPVTAQLAHTLLRTVDAGSACAVVVPVANPDGILGGMRQNARGVDLNRNFPTSDWSPEPSPTFWPTTMTRSSEHRTQMSSPGSDPGSEPEVQGLISLLERVQPCDVVDLHTPLECVLAMRPEAEPLAEQLAALSGMRVLHQLESPTPGDASTWCAEQGIASVTYETEAAALPVLWHRHAAALAHAVTAGARMPVSG